MNSKKNLTLRKILRYESRQKQWNLVESINTALSGITTRHFVVVLADTVKLFTSARQAFLHGRFKATYYITDPNIQNKLFAALGTEIRKSERVLPLSAKVMMLFAYRELQSTDTTKAAATE